MENILNDAMASANSATDCTADSVNEMETSGEPGNDIAIRTQRGTEGRE